jgi:hypothetical protein
MLKLVSRLESSHGVLTGLVPKLVSGPVSHKKKKNLNQWQGQALCKQNSNYWVCEEP